MSYLVLARKWRPQGFDDLVGQEPINRILSNAISQGRLAHAYLFSGPRGVGKTTTARILAKALNCEQGPTAVPCGACSFCKGITDGSSVYVMEIDGASNNSVNDIRDLRDRVKYAPAGGRYKVYIIDEAHMLSDVTGDALGSLRCDCRDQLEMALRAISAHDRGLVLYLRQEGRGIGLLNKIRAYQLQDGGLDTVEAILALGFRDDERDFAVAAHMLHTLGINSVRLMTNNPKKVDELRQYQINVVERVPHIIPPNEHNRFYLETKSRRSGHWIDFSGHPHLPEQADGVQVAGMASTDAG